jgi:DnaJ family protein A protein 5
MAGVRPEDFVDVYAYFTSHCYAGFGDGQHSFYGVYSSLFSTIGKQESDASAARADKRGSSSDRNLPEFGLSSAEWSEVSVFYAEWASFASARDFSWAAEYNTALAPTRQIRRLMEQDNAKKIKAAKKEYNESVRTLVDFVKKRDRRVIVHQMEEANKRQERQAAEAARREAEKQGRLLRAAQYKFAAWAQGSDNGSDNDDDMDEEDMLGEQLVWSCPVCEKHFKSEASMANHEKSKKHKELVELLRIELEAEQLGVIMEEYVEEGEEEEREIEGREEGEDEEINSETTRRICEEEESLEGDLSASSSDDSSEVTNAASSCFSAEDVHVDVDNNDDDGEEEMDEDAMLARLLNARANLGRKGNGIALSSEEEESEDGGEERTKEAAAVKEENGNGKEEEELIEEEEETGEQRPGSGPPLILGGYSNSDVDDDDWGTHKNAKKKGKKGAAGGNRSGGHTTEQQQLQQSRKAGKKKAAAASGKQPTSSVLRCSICGVEFASRNQLFKHISQAGHAQFKTSQ